MSKKISSIKLSESCYYTILRSVIESWPREVMGEIYGKKESHVKASHAYQFVTAERKPTYVSYGNNEAINRLRRLDHVISRDKYLKNKLIGGFHSHVITRSNRGLHRRDQNSLSKEDLEFIRQELEMSGKEEWIEVLIRVEKKDYSTPAKEGKKVTFLGKKMKIIIRDRPLEGYELTFSAFHISKDMKVSEIKIRNGAMTKS